MDLNQLEVFLSVSTTKSFSETGKQLHRSQSSVTRTIKQLEMELGSTLFHRNTHTVELTNSGKVLVPYAKEMLHLQEKIKRNISYLEKTVTGPLKLGASLTIADAVLPGLFEKYQTRYPQVQLQVKIDTSQSVIEALQNREIHFGLTEADIVANNISSTPFMEDELVVVVKHDHEIAKKDSITLHELAKLPLIMREKGSGIRSLIENMMNKEGIKLSELEIVMELNGTETIKRMVTSGLGASIVSRACVQREIDLNQIKPLSLKPRPFKRHFFYSFREDGALSPSIEAFKDLLIEIYESNISK